MSAVEKFAPIQHELLDVSYYGAIGSHEDKGAEYIARIAGEKIRVVIRLNSYAQQSWAKAELLSTEKTWTRLVDEPVANWHKEAFGISLTRSRTLDDLHAALDAVAARLFSRAERVVS
jgi:hypothetical protein